MCLPFYVNRPAWVQYSVNESGMWQPVFCFNHFSWFEIVCRLIPPSLTSIVSWEQTTRLHSFNITLNAKWETLAQHTPYKDIQNAPALYTIFKWQVESGRALKRGDSTADIVMVWLNFNILTSKKATLARWLHPFIDCERVQFFFVSIENLITLFSYDFTTKGCITSSVGGALYING